MSVQGSGWSVLAWEPLAGRLVVEQVYDHQDNVGQGSVPPLLVLDMWEHAFYLQYENVKADWVQAFWNLVNWEVAAPDSPKSAASSCSDRSRHRREQFG